MAVVDDRAVVEEASGYIRKFFWTGESRSRQVDTGRSCSLGDEDEGLIVVDEVTVEVDGYGVGEATLGTQSSGGAELDREEVESIMGPIKSGEDNGACRIRIHVGVGVSGGRSWV